MDRQEHVGASDAALLEVRGLTVTYRLRGGRVLQAVRGVDLKVGAGEVVALVGESGSGKSSAVRGIMQLHRPPPARCGSPAGTCAGCADGSCAGPGGGCRWSSKILSPH